MTAVFTCDCHCHLPIGFRLIVGKTPPPIMKPCASCERDHLLFQTQTERTQTMTTNAVRVLTANLRVGSPRALLRAATRGQP